MGDWFRIYGDEPPAMIKLATKVVEPSEYRERKAPIFAGCNASFTEPSALTAADCPAPVPLVEKIPGDATAIGSE